MRLLSRSDALATTDPATPAADDTPNWVQDSSLYQRVEEFIRATYQLLVRPHAFIDRWLGGEAGLPNPLHFWLAAVTYGLACSDVSQKLLVGPPAALTLRAHLFTVVQGYFVLPTFALFCHLGARVGGGRRSLRASIAAVLFAAGGPVTFLSVLTQAGLVIAQMLGHPPMLIPLSKFGEQPEILELMRFRTIPFERVAAQMLASTVYSTLLVAFVQRVRWYWTVLGYLFGAFGVTLVFTALTQLYVVLARHGFAAHLTP